MLDIQSQRSHGFPIPTSHSCEEPSEGSLCRGVQDFGVFFESDSVYKLEVVETRDHVKYFDSMMSLKSVL